MHYLPVSRIAGKHQPGASMKLGKTILTSEPSDPTTGHHHIRIPAMFNYKTSGKSCECKSALDGVDLTTRTVLSGYNRSITERRNQGRKADEVFRA